MKNSKQLFPLIAFCVAIGVTALSIQANANHSYLVTVKVSLPFPAPCAAIGTCTRGGENFCTTIGGTVVREFISPGPPPICGFSVIGSWDE